MPVLPYGAGKSTSGGTGTVTSVSVVGVNGLAGTVATATTTPAITLSTSVTGVLQGNGTAISAATTTGTGSVVLAASPALTGTPTTITQTANDNSTKIASTAYVDVKAGTQSLIRNEVPGGLVNSANTAYTTASSFSTNTLRVYKNGLRLKGGGIDYTAGASSFTTVVAPATGAILLVDYEVGSSNFSVGSNSIIVGEVPTGLVNSTNTVYTTTRAYIGGSVEIMVNGVAQARTTHFTETTPSTGIITMSDAPLTGDIITVNYQFNLNPASNSDTVDGIHASATPVANQLLALNGSTKLPVDVLGTGAAKNAVATSETTASTAYTSLATSQAVTVIIGANGLAFVSMSSALVTTSGACAVSFVVSGANTLAATDLNAIVGNTSQLSMAFTKLLTGLTAGSTTFTLQFRVTAGTGTFLGREIAVIPL